MSPSQAALGRQPRMTGDVLGSFSQHLAEHGLIDANPSMARQMALRETAKLAITRLHFSRSIRRSELARSRATTEDDVPEPGAMAYFWRLQKYNNRNQPTKKRLTLKRWHGPALVVAREGANMYLSYKGQLFCRTCQTCFDNGADCSLYLERCH